MKISKVLAATLTSICMAFTIGCESIIPLSPSSDVSAVIIGVENGYAGKCPGALKDAQRMKEILKKHAKDVVVLTDMQATTANVLAAIERAVRNDGLAFIYYSGHGGQYLSGNPDEADNADEFLCCYDDDLIDDDIWEAICKARGRVFLMFDCCHSETMFKSPGITFAKPMRRMAASPTSAGVLPDMLCWSGCPDDSYSYSNEFGGFFTLEFIDQYSPLKSYSDIWSALQHSKRLKATQLVRSTKLGHFDTSKKIFK